MENFIKTIKNICNAILSPINWFYDCYYNLKREKKYAKIVLIFLLTLAILSAMGFVLFHVGRFVLLHFEAIFFGVGSLIILFLYVKSTKDSNEPSVQETPEDDRVTLEQIDRDANLIYNLLSDIMYEVLSNMEQLHLVNIFSQSDIEMTPHYQLDKATNMIYFNYKAELRDYETSLDEETLSRYKTIILQKITENIRNGHYPHFSTISVVNGRIVEPFFINRIWKDGIYLRIEMTFNNEYTAATNYNKNNTGTSATHYSRTF